MKIIIQSKKVWKQKCFRKGEKESHGEEAINMLCDMWTMCQIAAGQLDKNKETVGQGEGVGRVKNPAKRIYIHRRLEFQTSSK